MRSFLPLLLIAGCGNPDAARKRPDASGAEDASADATGSDAAVDAGSDGSVVTVTNTSGSRLKLQWADLAGNRTSPSIYDSERAEPCRKEQWADDRFYCTPPAELSFALNIYDRYLDSQCQSLLAVDLGGEYAAIGVQRCGGEVIEQKIEHLYKLGTPVTQYYERRSDGSCVGPFEDDFFRYQPATEVPVTQLVPLEREIDSAPGRLAHIVLTSSDGLRLEDGVRDRTLDLECAFEKEEQLATTARCVPTGHAQSHWYYADATCARPAVVDDGCSQPTRARQTLDTRTHCVLEPEPWRAVGPSVTSKFERNLSPPYNCVTAENPQWIFRELGAELQIAEAPRVLDAAGPRITQIHNIFAGRAFDDHRLYDRDLGTECTPDTSFGDLRCVPPRWPVKYGFTDAACTTPITLMPVERGPASCAIPKTGAHIATTFQAVFQVGAPYTGQYYEKPSTICVPRAFASDEAHLRVTQVSPSVLATGSVVIDP